MGLRYVRVEPQERGGTWLDLRATEMHRPPVYLATIRLHAGRTPAADLDHVRDVARPMLERLGCSSIADYLERGRIIARARAAISASSRDPELAFERGREVVTARMEPRECEVVRVRWRGEHALTFWLPGPHLAWASPAFRRDPRIRPEAVEHGFTYVPWVLAELAPVRDDLLASPRVLDLGLPLETGRAAP